MFLGPTVEDSLKHLHKKAGKVFLCERVRVCVFFTLKTHERSRRLKKVFRPTSMHHQKFPSSLWILLHIDMRRGHIGNVDKREGFVGKCGS